MSSKTGLTVSSVKCGHSKSKRRTSLELNLLKCSIAKPVQFSLRPFGGLYNPYSSSCSILCNHPGPNEVKNVLRQVKEQYIEAKSCHFKDDRPCSRPTMHDDYETLHADPDRIPDEFYQRFTGSDSRPLTPTPTVASQRTRGSVGSQLVFHTRRCLTPDPVNSSGVGERKQIILDLRRSHSQETLFWNASSELSVPPSTTTVHKLNTKETHASSPSPASVKNMRLCEQEAARKRSAEQKKAQEMEAKATATTTIVCIHDRSDGNEGDNDADGMKRRGKKKKKSKLATSNTFHMSQEPETLIATLGPDSPNQSARPSLVPTHPNAGMNQSNSVGDQPKDGKYLQSSFITEDALKLLRRGLNIDIVENAFERFVIDSRWSRGHANQYFCVILSISDEQSTEGSFAHHTERSNRCGKSSVACIQRDNRRRWHRRQWKMADDAAEIHTFVGPIQFADKHQRFGPFDTVHISQSTHLDFGPSQAIVSFCVQQIQMWNGRPATQRVLPRNGCDNCRRYAIDSVRDAKRRFKQNDAICRRQRMHNEHAEFGRCINRCAWLSRWRHFKHNKRDSRYARPEWRMPIYVFDVPKLVRYCCIRREISEFNADGRRSVRWGARKFYLPFYSSFCIICFFFIYSVATTHRWKLSTLNRSSDDSHAFTSRTSWNLFWISLNIMAATVSPWHTKAAIKQIAQKMTQKLLLPLQCQETLPTNSSSSSRHYANKNKRTTKKMTQNNCFCCKRMTNSSGDFLIWRVAHIAATAAPSSYYARAHKNRLQFAFEFITNWWWI